MFLVQEDCEENDKRLHFKSKLISNSGNLQSKLRRAISTFSVDAHISEKLMIVFFKITEFKNQECSLDLFNMCLSFVETVLFIP